MTAYFDQFNFDLYEVDLADVGADERLRQLDERVVHDVSVWAEWPGMDVHLRDSIYQVLLECSWVVHEHLDGSMSDGPADTYAYRSQLVELGHRLHSIAHEVGHWAREQPEEVGAYFSDDPRHCLVEHVARSRFQQERVGRRMGVLMSEEQLRAKRAALGWFE